MDGPTSTLIAGVYDAVTDIDRRACLLDDLTHTLRATACVRVTATPAGPPAVRSSRTLDASRSTAYANYYCKLDPWVARLGAYRAGSIVSGETFLPNAALEQTEFYNDFLEPQRLYWCRSAVLDVSESGASYVTLMRSRHAKDFSTQDEHLLAALLPHLRTALTLERSIGELEWRTQMLESALDALGFGIALVRQGGEVAYLNLQAEKLLRIDSGLKLLSGRLRVHDHAADKQLQAALSIACHGDVPLVQRRTGVVQIRRGRGTSSIRMLVAPFRAGRGWTHGTCPEAIILFSDGGQSKATREDYLTHAFGMTPSETQIALLLARGTSIKDIGNLLGITANTTRTHLKHVYIKTATHRQAALVELLIRELALFESLAMDSTG